eukprot:3014136-Pleurochrysis_carterae.AAC.1
MRCAPANAQRFKQSRRKQICPYIDYENDFCESWKLSRRTAVAAHPARDHETCGQSGEDLRH